MQLKKIIKEDNTTKIFYDTTFRVGWSEMTGIIDTIITKDFGKENGKIYSIRVGEDISDTVGVEYIDELKKTNNDINECSFIRKEKGMISISGYSSIMEENMKIILWNQLDKYVIEIENEKYIEKDGEHVYDRYVDSIEIGGFVNSALKQINKTQEVKMSSNTESENEKDESNNYECFLCHTKFFIDPVKISSNQRTFYYICPNCNAELKFGNPNYKENLTDRDRLIKEMELPKGIRKLGEQEQNAIIRDTIIRVNKLLKEIRCDATEYELSLRQLRTKSNAINNTKSKNYLEAFYEVLDFVDDNGDRHNGIIFEKEKREINDLLEIVYNNIQQ